MPKEIKVIFRLLKAGSINDKEAFQLLWMAFVAMTGYKAQEEENCCAEPAEYREVRGFRATE